MTPRTRRTLVVVALGGSLLGACKGGDGAERASPNAAERAPAGAIFSRSPGGTFEVEPEEAERLRRAGEARVIDVRESEELTDDLGHIPGVEHVPLGELAAAAERWDPDAPVVLVCRTGRRSARGVEALEAMGFREVASMTGGMLRWSERGLPTSGDRGDVRTLTAEPTSARRAPAIEVKSPPGAPPLRIDPGDVRWVRTASLLGTGSESCVDGRDPHAVVGTPGGDAGEFVVAVAALESVAGAPLTRAELEALLDDWIDTFGRFYVHTDVEALAHLRAAVLADPRFAARGVAPVDARAVETLVRHPPAGLEEALLDHLVSPENVGCGHLRGMVREPEAFEVRRGLPEEVLRATFRHLFRAPEEIDWVVLEGEHHEQAVVIVDLEGEVHPYTWVPALPPSIEGRQAFVVHPEVTAFLREQNAHFLRERSPELAKKTSAAELLARMQRLAEVQQAATLARLASGLPVYEARIAARR